jgi:hypothetical protein
VALYKEKKSKIFIASKIVAEHFNENRNQYKAFNYIDNNPLNIKSENLIWVSNLKSKRFGYFIKNNSELALKSHIGKKRIYPKNDIIEMVNKSELSQSYKIAVLKLINNNDSEVFYNIFNQICARFNFNKFKDCSNFIYDIQIDTFLVLMDNLKRGVMLNKTNVNEIFDNYIFKSLKHRCINFSNASGDYKYREKKQVQFLEYGKHFKSENYFESL